MAEQKNAGWIKSNFPGYAGWNDPASIEADFRATGGSGKEGGGAQAVTGVQGGDLQSTVQQAQQMLSQAQKPAIASLQAQQPITEQRFAGQREELAGKEETMKTRYSNLLEDIKGRETRETTQATRIQAQELGRRGIAPGGTFYEQEIQGARQPISQAYGGLTRDIGLAQSEEALGLAGLGKQLTVDEQQAQQDINAAIASIQSATSTQAVEVAMQQLQQAQQAQQFAQSQATQRYGIDVGAQAQSQQLALQQAQQQIEQQQYQQQWPYQQRQYEYQLNQPYYKPEETDPYLSMIQDLLGGQSDISDTQTETKPASTPSRQGVDYTSPMGQWKWDWEDKDWYPVTN